MTDKYKSQMVNHINLIGHEINDSLDNDYPTQDRKVFCRWLMKVTEPLRKDCTRCPYFNGLAQGNGHECLWKDVVSETTFIVQHKDAIHELERVNELIEKGVIPDGTIDDTENTDKRQ